jgi:hypothetical protein
VEAGTHDRWPSALGAQVYPAAQAGTHASIPDTADEKRERGLGGPSTAARRRTGGSQAGFVVQHHAGGARGSPSTHRATMPVPRTHSMLEGQVTPLQGWVRHWPPSPQNSFGGHAPSSVQAAEGGGSRSQALALGCGLRGTQTCGHSLPAAPGEHLKVRLLPFCRQLGLLAGQVAAVQGCGKHWPSTHSWRPGQSLSLVQSAWQGSPCGSRVKRPWAEGSMRR